MTLIVFLLYSLIGKYDKYGSSKEFTLEISKAISAAANVSIIRVNGIRVRISMENQWNSKSCLHVTKDCNL